MGAEEGRAHDLLDAEDIGVAVLRHESSRPSSWPAQCVPSAERRPCPCDVRSERRRRPDVSEQRWPTPALAAAGLLFVLLATINSAGYRYGVSDQAFHIPAAVRALDPAAFPRDRAVLDPQAHLMLFDDAVAMVARATGLSLEALFLAGYLVTAALLWTAILLIGRTLLRSPLATLLFGTAVTLR